MFCIRHLPEELQTMTDVIVDSSDSLSAFLQYIVAVMSGWRKCWWTT